MQGMKHVACISLVAAALLGAPGVHAQGLAGAAWLAGCWTLDDAEPGSTEQWMVPAGGTMLGMARTIKNGRMVAHEFLQIRERADGSLIYIARPSGQAEAQFPLSQRAEGELQFENLAHDFPQRIIYRRQSGERLLARIEGRRANGEARTVDFPMRRGDCR
jgi:Domain of unknown function (DUF6265)